MSSFLQHITERHFSAVPRVRPRRHSHFEDTSVGAWEVEQHHMKSPAEQEGTVEDSAAAQSLPTPQAHTPGPEQRTTPVVSPSTVKQRNEPPPSDLIVNEVPFSPLRQRTVNPPLTPTPNLAAISSVKPTEEVPEATASDLSASSAKPTERTLLPTDVFQQTPRTIQANESGDEHLSSRTSTASALPNSTGLIVNVSANTTGQARTATAQEVARPVIKVHIGRIEVKTKAAPKPAKTQKKPKPNSPKLTLAQFLNNREG